MYPPLDLRQIHCFVTAARRGTMTAAAEEMRLSPSAISLAITALERRLGEQLLIRRRARSLLLTPAGRRFLPAARDLLAHAQQVQRDAHSDSSLIAGPLLVGCFRTAAPFVLPPLLQSFSREHPRVELDFVEGPVPEIEAALLDGRCDLAITYTVSGTPGLAYEPLRSAAPYALFDADHRLAHRRTVTVAELAEEEMVMLDLAPSREYFQQVFEAFGVLPRIRWRTSSYELVRSLVGRGLGYGLLVSRPAGDLSYEGRPLVCVPLAGDPPRHQLTLVRVEGARATRQARAFAEHCHAQLQEP